MPTRHDARWFSETVGAIYAAISVEELTTSAMQSLDARFSLHSFACEEVGRQTAFYQLYKLRCGAPPPLDHSVYLHDNPFSIIMRSPVKLPPIFHMRAEEDFAAWQRTDHFNGIARPMGWNDQLVVVAESEPNLVAFGIYRDARFSEDEAFLASLLQPHLAAAWARVQPERGSLYAGEQFLQLDATLRPHGLTGVQAAMLRAYFPGWRPVSGLPEVLRTWVRISLAQLQRDLPSRPLFSFKTDSVRGTLWVRCFPQAGGVARLVFSERQAIPNFLQLRTAGLTTRECEVLHWIAQGKRDAEIASIIACAPATVSKHIERVLRKLHAENRGAAVSLARERLGG